jgi:hypothetical protein
MAERKRTPAAEEVEEKEERARPPRPEPGSEKKPRELTRAELEALRQRLQKKFH